MERLTVRIGKRKDADVFVRTLGKIVRDGSECSLSDEKLREMVYKKRTRTNLQMSCTMYFFSIEEEHPFAEYDTERLMDKVISAYIKDNFSYDCMEFRAQLDCLNKKNEIPDKTVLYEVESLGGTVLLKQSYISPQTKRGDIISDPEKQYLYNLQTGKWDEADDIDRCFLKKSEGEINIDCKAEDSRRVIDLFVRALTRLYMRTACLEYRGTNNKHDDYLRDYVKRTVCEPVVTGRNVHCKIWNPASGASTVNDYEENPDVASDMYDSDGFTTFDHAFKSFYGRCRDIEFVALVTFGSDGWIEGYEVYFTKNGKVMKINREDWVKPYSFNVETEDDYGEEW